ncbi:protein phosphatase 2C domain-containing protein [Streptomyces sp. NBC_00503]|uniref:protein phosphatase 2C domain-containing protein n=1 Tax=Streptomyces sp. NBC_00503 TaxID=2903659 RepID=UPI002E823E90|nr:protein phosphatase 2C domain-containing protein [Streptomyces sp. NBC_00503]WUD84252.1 protein phosphatase 2C domain-containing protein [Streptomyces sp. NBC_00503]
MNKTRNQDHYEVEGLGTAGSPLIMAVADGHGSAVHARSHLGSRFAVDLFVQEARLFAALAQPRGEERPPSLAWLMRYAEYAFPRQLVSAWRDRVLGNWERASSHGEPPVRDEEKLLLYGSTFVGAVLTPRVFAAWQLGDGELTIVGDDGVAVPLAPQEADLGDETESLCTPEAWLRVRTHWAPVTAPSRAPRLVALSTDGLSKSFASDMGFRQFMTGLDERLSAEGTERVRAALPQWLGKASQHSGDDTTLVAAWHTTEDPRDPHDPEATAEMTSPAAPPVPAVPVDMEDLRDPYRSDE